MNTPPRLSDLLNQRHDYILRNLQDASSFISHPTEKGDASEQVWLEALKTYLPSRYDVRKGFAIDSSSNYSNQIDIIIHDRFYTPFLLKVGGFHIVPIESVYAVFEVKQTLNAENIKYAIQKTRSVRLLQRKYKQTKEVPDQISKHIIAGILTTKSGYSGGLDGKSVKHMDKAGEDERLDYICVGEQGFAFRKSERTIVEQTGSWITSFILSLVGELQNLGTVSPIDIESYRSSCL